ncbi:MAG: YbaY family lipoprotein [Thiolinea sp.]
MNRILSLITALTTLLLISACTSPQAPDSDNKAEAAANAIVKGSVGYRERIQPPPGAKLQVRLDDVSLADAPSTTLTEQVIDLGGRSVPVNYVLTVADDRMQANRRYAVHAEIRGADDRLLWTTDQMHPVDPEQAMQTLPPITMVKVGGQSSQPASAPPGLLGKEWRVEDLNGRGVVDNSRTALLFTADGQVSGSTGCNNFSGSYTTLNGTLNFGPLAVTERACVPSLGDQESKFLELMNAVDRFSFDATGALILKTQDGRTLRARQ